MTYVPIPDDLPRIPLDLDATFHLMIHDIPTAIRIVNITEEERLTIYVDGDHLFSRYGVILSDTHECNPKKRWWQWR